MSIKEAIFNFLKLKNEGPCNNEDKYKSNHNTNNDNDLIKSILSQIKSLEVNDKLAENEIKNLKNLIIWLQAFIAFLIAIIGFIIPCIFNMHARAIDKSIETYSKEVSAKFELIGQQLNSQKEINSLQIERDIERIKTKGDK